MFSHEQIIATVALAVFVVIAILLKRWWRQMSASEDDRSEEESESAEEPWINITGAPNGKEPLIAQVLNIYGMAYVIGTLIIISWQFLTGSPYRPLQIVVSFFTSLVSGLLVLGIAAILRCLLRIEMLLERNQKNGDKK